MKHLNLFAMKNKPLKCVYRKSKTDKLWPGEVNIHIFSRINNRDNEFFIYGFTQLDNTLKNIKKDSRLEITYKGLRNVFINSLNKKIKCHRITILEY